MDESWVAQARLDFPILQRPSHEAPLAYLDNAATTQKPKQVIEALVHFYENSNANVHRGIYALSEEASRLYEEAREKVAAFIQAPCSRSIVFTRGTTEAINLVAHSWLKPRLQAGDEILLTALEHHSNVVPWQMVAQATGAKTQMLPLNEEGTLDLQMLAAHLKKKSTKMLALCHISNVLGTVNPLEKIVALAHEHHVPVLVDAAQSVARQAVNVEALNCDFFAFSAHKMYGPTGIGVLYGKPEHLEVMEPWMGGGGMIQQVGDEHSTWAESPAKFEAGTPPIAEAVGLSAAIDYLAVMGMERIARHEHNLLAHALALFKQIPDVEIHPPLEMTHKAGVLSFNLAEVHPHDVAQILDLEGVAVRAGHHCAQPLMRHLNTPATVRLSVSLYNQMADIDRLVQGLEKVRELFLEESSLSSLSNK